ncbi:putative zinc finger protein [Albidovulum inexpectatum]|uniref:Putative zinc finger protein n=1 Tax=Albidovulum inexpectatum TaxID=196587 RepID=A0A2S5JI03_9RHOB|nr:zf-HC2 domain-containing protein [Albidovulum inexpectatum]PPB80978.1 putative zinc finger protein [Albidovulum inexpectatum]
MLSCKDVAARASALIDRELSMREALQMRLHLIMCRGCRHFVRQVRLTDRLVARVANADQPPDPGPEKLLAILRDKRPPGR